MTCNSLQDEITVFLNKKLMITLTKTPEPWFFGLLPEDIRKTNRMWLWLQLGTTTEGKRERMEMMCKMATY